MFTVCRPVINPAAIQKDIGSFWKKALRLGTYAAVESCQCVFEM